jgi:hypothetical protein
MDPFRQLEYEFSEKLYTTQIKYYIGLHYANERQYGEAHLILNRVQQDIENTIEFAQKNALQSQKVKRDLKELEEKLLTSLNYLVCKCHARLLQASHEHYTKVQSEMASMQIDTTASGSKGAADGGATRQVRFDNLYDVLFSQGTSGAGEASFKQNTTKKLVIKGDHLDFLEDGGKNIQMQSTFGDKKTFEVERAKISKTFKLVNPVPKFQSVPAAPQFFDLAGAYLAYPALDEPLTKYKVQAGIFSKFKGFFGRS